MSPNAVMDRVRDVLPNPRNPGAARSTGTGIYKVLALAFIVAWILVAGNGGDFMTVSNIKNILVRSVSLGIVAVGQTLVIIGASLDLSVVYLISVTAVLAGVVMDGNPDRMILAIFVVSAVGMFVGFINGILITKVKTHAFIATLGTGLILKGALSSKFSNFSGSVPDSFQRLGYSEIGPLPVSVLLLAAVATSAWFLLRKTQFGAHLYAVGGDLHAARLSGVRADRVIIMAHVLCSLTAVLTGLFIVARLGSGAPWVGPDGAYDLESIAAVVVGGTALMGGKGGVGGTIAGVFLLALLDSAFNALEVNSFLKQVVRGGILIAAVATYAVQNRRAEG